jgi:trehalose synthase
VHGRNAGELPDEREHAAYIRWAAENSARLVELASAHDLMVLHDPQALPMAAMLADQGFRAAWRCHIGTSAGNMTSKSTWEYLSQFWRKNLILVFSDAALVPEQAENYGVEVIPPSIDPCSVKNMQLGDGEIRDILLSAGLPEDGDPVILQVSRWDPLKDMSGVLQAFCESDLPRTSRLVLCGPSPASIVDDPEAGAVFAEVFDYWQALPQTVARRVHLLQPVLDDGDSNARLVNALQRRATVVAQKSLQEGFGLTVTEAMWKARPVVASRVGGIQAQIIHKQSGLLLDDPNDLPGFVDLLTEVLNHPAYAADLGRAAAHRVGEHFTVQREIDDHYRLYSRIASTG